MIALFYGLLVGAALGLTGGGGSIFAIPLLVYGLGLPLPEAAGLSLAAVGLMAGFGAAVQRRSLETRAGLVFAAAGMAFAPAGAALGHALPAALVLSVFALSGVASHVLQGAVIPWAAGVLFVSGGLAGMLVGGRGRERLSPERLRVVFAYAMWVVALFILARNLPVLLS